MTNPFHSHLSFLYGADRASELVGRLQKMLDGFRDEQPQQARHGRSVQRVTHQDAILITYGDMVQAPDNTHLQTLASFLHTWLYGVVSTVHILPFYPYSSDDGFSVIDYNAVNPDLGRWQDMDHLDKHFRLMFDAVINHISAHSEWFQRFLQDDPAYRDYFTVVEPDIDLTAVFRPRALPLLTPVETAVGIKHVWTTFSSDQIDLNYAHPEVLFDVIKTLFLYISKGAEFIRLDAIGFMWKEIGTNCIHLPQTHRAIQLMRAVLNEVTPHVALITETNVPHEDNISYFGNGRNEAQLVYNFSLPPLTLHAFHTGNAETLSQWASTLTPPSDEVTFFNFLASHDGIGLTPTKGILSDTAVSQMAQRVEALGGRVSYKNNPDGSQSAYELNINYLDALCNPNVETEPINIIVRRFLASQAIMLALRGVPGIYFHSLFGSRNWHEGVAQSGRNRSINRQKLQLDSLEAELNDMDSLRHHVFHGYRQLLQARSATPAFHPNGEQRVLDCHPAIFALWRRGIHGRSALICLHNVSSQAHNITVDLSASRTKATQLIDLLDGTAYMVDNGRLNLDIKPYNVLWLELKS